MIVIPQGDSHEFRYHDLHLEYNRLQEQIAKTEIANIILDLSRMRTLSSIMIATLARLAVLAVKDGGKCIVCGASSELREVIDTHQLLQFGEMVGTREDALKAIEG